MIDQAPDQVPVDRVGRQRRGDGHQRRRLQEQRDRPPLEVAQVGDQQEEQEEPEEEDLVGPADLDHLIEYLPRGLPAARLRGPAVVRPGRAGGRAAGRNRGAARSGRSRPRAIDVSRAVAGSCLYTVILRRKRSKTQYSLTPGGEIFGPLLLVIPPVVAPRGETNSTTIGGERPSRGPGCGPGRSRSPGRSGGGFRAVEGLFGQRRVDDRALRVCLLIAQEQVAEVLVRVDLRIPGRWRHDEDSPDEFVAIADRRSRRRRRTPRAGGAMPGRARAEPEPLTFRRRSSRSSEASSARSGIEAARMPFSRARSPARHPRPRVSRGRGASRGSRPGR